MTKPGDLVSPNIRLERMLSEGGMGSVWLADHLTLETQVAVKFMTAELAGDPDSLARFTREATAAAHIKSPHVVQISDHGVSPDGVPYIVMELLHGEDLDVRISRDGKLGLAETVQVVRHVCKALAKAHQGGIVHRDIKPANLFLVDVEGDVFVKVLDFGIAKRTKEIGDGVTRTGMMVGTPHFMSPEQVTSAKDVDFRADLWAVAVVAYNCLTGRRPFEGDTIGALSIAINNAVFVPPTVIVPELPRPIDLWFSRALARTAEDRFHSAREMADALVASVPREARSLRPPPEAPPKAGTHPSRAPTMAARPAPAASAPATLGGASMASTGGGVRRAPLAIAAVAVAIVALGVTLFLTARRSEEPTPATMTPTATTTTATTTATSTATATTTATATATSTATPESSIGAPSATHAPAKSPPPPRTSAPTPTSTAKDRGF